MFITFVGGGNSTPIMACLAKKAGHTVAVLTRKPEKWPQDKVVGFKNEDTEYLDGVVDHTATIDIITADPAECIPQSEMIFIAGLPIHHNPAVIKSFAQHIDKEKQVFLGSICGYGGFNWVASDALGPGFDKVVPIATQLIPWCCGTIEYGKTGVVFGAKRMLRIATEDGKDPHNIKVILNGILKIPELRDTDFLSSCFWPNNPVLHPPILYGLFSEWDGKTGFDKEKLPVLIYAEMVKASAETMRKLDNEICSIIDALKPIYPDNKHLQQNFHLEHCIKENYLDQVKDGSNLETTVKTNKAFGSHKIPYTTLEDGKIVPTLAHKFFETDLPYGLCTFKDVAVMAGVETPMMDAIILWNQGLIGKEFLKDGKICGKDAGECVVPSALGLELETLDKGRWT